MSVRFVSDFEIQNKVANQAGSLIMDKKVGNDTEKKCAKFEGDPWRHSKGQTERATKQGHVLVFILFDDESED